MPFEKKARLQDLQRLHVDDRNQLRAWLEQNHLTSPGVWLLTYRRKTGRPRPGIDEIVEELLCFGWIDSTMKKVDETETMLLCTPRRPTSHWSRSNRDRVFRLTQQGLMRPRGLEVVALAQANGSFTSLEAVEDCTEPPDLSRLLDASQPARQHWDAFPPSYRQGLLHWVQDAKRPSTRQVRLDAVVASASEGRRLYGTPAGLPRGGAQVESK